MKIVITGASGLVARYIIEDMLANTNASIYTLSSNPQSLKERYQNNSRIVCFDKNAISTNPNLASVLNGAVLVHAAFTRKNDGVEVATSIDYARDVFSFARNANVARIFNISSRSVYREPEAGVLNTEDSVICPSGLIGIGKYGVEVLLDSIFNGSNIPYSNLRLASVNELKIDNTMVRPLNVFVDCVMSGKNIHVIGGMQVMSFIDPRDVATAIRSLVYVEDKMVKTVYNIGTGWLCTMNLLDMAKLVVEVGKEKGYPEVKLDVEEKLVNQRAGLDISRLYADTDWTPQITLKHMINSLYNIKENNGYTEI